MMRSLTILLASLMMAISTPLHADGMVEVAAAAHEKAAEAFDLPTDVEILLDTPSMLAETLAQLEFAEKATSDEEAANLRLQLAELLDVELSALNDSTVRIWLLLKLADAPAGQVQLLNEAEQALFSNMFCHAALELSAGDPTAVVEMLYDANLACWAADE